MTSAVLERDRLLDMMQEWLNVYGVTGKEKFEMFFLPNEIVIRPHSPQRGELHAWLDDAIRRYGDVLERLANS